MEITYSSTRCDQWRCHVYVMSHRPLEIFSLLVGPFTVSFWLIPFYHPLGLWAYPAAFLTALLGLALILAGLLHAMIVQRLPTPASQRICTTAISPEGFRDVTPDKTMEYVWTQISDIRLHENDFYFWVGGTKGNFIPSSAFDDRREAQLFFETAVQYWRAAKSGQAAVLPSRDGVWPPAPRQ